MSQRASDAGVGLLRASSRHLDYAMDPDDSAGSSRDPFGTSWGAGARFVQAAGMRGQALSRVSQDWYDMKPSQRGGVAFGFARSTLSM